MFDIVARWMKINNGVDGKLQCGGGGEEKEKRKKLMQAKISAATDVRKSTSPIAAMGIESEIDF